jgi:hypothetical protein
MEAPFWEIELNDGSVVRLNLNFGSLYALRESPEREVYEEYARIRMKEQTDELDGAYIVYTAYVCANRDGHLSFRDFLDKLPPDRSVLSNAIDMMLEPKKKRALQQRLRSALLPDGKQ